MKAHITVMIEGCGEITLALANEDMISDVSKYLTLVLLSLALLLRGLLLFTEETNASNIVIPLDCSTQTIFKIERALRYKCLGLIVCLVPWYQIMHF